jgi:hypothetical protein
MKLYDRQQIPCTAATQTNFVGRTAAGSGKSADLILHHGAPHLKNHRDETVDFKNYVKNGWRTLVWT